MTAAVKAYFWYHLRDKLKQLLFFTVIALALTFIFSANQMIESSYYEDGVMVKYQYFNWTVGSPLAVLLVCSTILPVIEFSCFKKRRNLDCFYGLPVSRRALGLIHYATGLIGIILPFTAGYLLNTLMMLRYPQAYAFGAVVGYYFVALFFAWCAYSFYVLIFNQANTTGDGIWFMILWSFLIYFIVMTINDLYYVLPFVHKRVNILNSGLSIYWLMQTGVMSCYQEVVEKVSDATLRTFWCNPEIVPWVIGWAVTGALSVGLFVRSFGKRRMEKTEEVSDSWFGFKIMIPMYAMLSVIGTAGSGIIWCTIFTFVGYLIYRRGFHLKLSDWIVMASLFLMNLVFCFTTYGR